MPESPASPPAAAPAGGRFRALRLNILLSILSTSLLLICIETTLRLAELAPTQTLAYPDEEMWARWPGPFAPNQDFVDRFRPRLPHRIRINGLGFRGREFPAEKPAGAYRILCLGDSYTFGDYLSDDETFPAALEKRLRQEFPGRAIEVINGGVNGYTITDEADLAREKGFSLGPDALIVGFVLNDLADLTRRVSSRDNQRIEARRMSESPLTPIKDLLRRTATYNLLWVIKASVMARLRLDPTIQEVPIRHLLTSSFDARTEALFERYRDELVRLDQDSRRHGCRVVLVLYPFYEQVVASAPAEAQARMSRIASEASIPVVDLLPAFKRAGARARRLFLMPLDHHPSSGGYRLAAREVARALRAEIPKTASPPS